MQVVVTGEVCHYVPPPAAAAGAAPGSKQLTIDGALGFSIDDPGERHPMRPYWEYCSFLFR